MNKQEYQDAPNRPGQDRVVNDISIGDNKETTEFETEIAPIPQPVQVEAEPLEPVQESIFPPIHPRPVQV